MDDRAWNSLVDLVSGWSNWELSRDWYLTSLVPEIVAKRTDADLSEGEREVVARLVKLLTEDEWRGLAAHVLRARDLMAHRESTRRAEVARRAAVAESQREADAARKRAAFEAKRRAIEEAEAHQRRAVEGEAARLRSLRLLLAQLQDRFRLDFLTARRWWDESERYGLSEEAFHSAACDFVKNWFETEVKTWVPDPEQARAIAHVDGHALVSARAGSGKTATMVARAVFLIRHCGVDPGEVLMLAFNKRAAGEMRERVATLLRGSPCPHVMTFHALAYRLVHPTQTLVTTRTNTAARKAEWFRLRSTHTSATPAGRARSVEP